MNKNDEVGKCMIEIGKCIRISNNDSGIATYKIEGIEGDINYRRWSVSEQKWDTKTRKIDLDLDRVTLTTKCPGESKGGARKRNTRRKSGTKRRH